MSPSLFTFTLLMECLHGSTLFLSCIMWWLLIKAGLARFIAWRFARQAQRNRAAIQERRRKATAAA